MDWYGTGILDDDLNGTSNPVNATIGGMNGTKGNEVTVVAGKFGNALQFSGSNTNSRVSFGSDSRKNFDGVFSVSLVDQAYEQLRHPIHSWKQVRLQQRRLLLPHVEQQQQAHHRQGYHAGKKPRRGQCVECPELASHR